MTVNFLQIGAIVTAIGVLIVIYKLYVIQR